jgi:hypothetical protein
VSIAVCSKYIFQTDPLLDLVFVAGAVAFEELDVIAALVQQVEAVQH